MGFLQLPHGHGYGAYPAGGRHIEAFSMTVRMLPLGLSLGRFIASSERISVSRGANSTAARRSGYFVRRRTTRFIYLAMFLTLMAQVWRFPSVNHLEDSIADIQAQCLPTLLVRP